MSSLFSVKNIWGLITPGKRYSPIKNGHFSLKFRQIFGILEKVQNDEKIERFLAHFIALKKISGSKNRKIRACRVRKNWYFRGKKNLKIFDFQNLDKKSPSAPKNKIF